MRGRRTLPSTCVYHIGEVWLSYSRINRLSQTRWNEIIILKTLKSRFFYLKYIDGEMSHLYGRRNVPTAICPNGEMSWRRSVPTAKCPNGEMSQRRSVPTAKCPNGEMSQRRNVPTAKCPTANCPTAKCPTAMCPSTVSYNICHLIKSL